MPPTATTDTEARPLTDAERTTLTDLLAREKGTPAARVGEQYVALACLSVPRRGEEEARSFNRKGVRDGRQVDVLRKVTGADGTHEAPPRLPPRALSGRLFRPATPPQGSDAPRPDPEGSSSISVLDDGRAPEGEPSRPDPSEMADHLRETVAVDAAYLPPRRARPGNRG